MFFAPIRIRKDKSVIKGYVYRSYYRFTEFNIIESFYLFFIQYIVIGKCSCYFLFVHQLINAPCFLLLYNKIFLRFLLLELTSYLLKYMYLYRRTNYLYQYIRSEAYMSYLDLILRLFQCPDSRRGENTFVCSFVIKRSFRIMHINNFDCGTVCICTFVCF